MVVNGSSGHMSRVLRSGIADFVIFWLHGLAQTWEFSHQRNTYNGSISFAQSSRQMLELWRVSVIHKGWRSASVLALIISLI